MKFLVSLLGCLALPHAAGLSLRSGAAEEKPLAFDAKKLQFHELQLMLDRMSDCRADPGTCSSSESEQAAIRMKNLTGQSINSTVKDFTIIISDLAACKFVDDKSFMSSFDDRVAKHTACRGRQVGADALQKTCQTLGATQKTLSTTTCTSGISGKDPSDFRALCDPAAGSTLGPWLLMMNETFRVKYKEWEAEQVLCKVATAQVRNTTERCTDLGVKLSSVVLSCEAELSALESFACSFASQNAGQCSVYDACYNSAIERYNKLVAAVPARIKTWKESWVTAEQLICFAKSADSAGTVDAAKMEACRNVSLIDTSRITVKIPMAPARKSCPDPLIYPGSREYRTRLYSGLPAGFEIRKPTLCRGWMGGCAARSTFDLAIVLLMYNNQNCTALAAGSVVCNGQQGQFMFQQQDTSTCMGQVKLLSQPSGAACRFDPLASLPSISCGGFKVAGDPPFTATLTSNPLASNRNGAVTLRFAGTSVVPMSNFGTLTKTDYDGYFERNCYSNGKRGAFRGVSSVHNNGREDRVFDWNCAYPSDGFLGFEDTNWLGGWTDWDANWQLACGSNEVITHVEARHDNGKEDRQYHMMCGRTPKGMSLDARPWTGWTNNFDNPSTVDCGADGVLVGIMSVNHNSYEDRIWAYRCATLSVNAPPQLSFQVEYPSAS